MADVHTKKQRSFNMSRIRGENTRPEVALRKALYAGGLRGYRIHYKLPGKPDIVMPQKRLAVFVDGCFWHRCPRCFQKPETNADFWKQKIDGNVERDNKMTERLRADSWRVIRFWEHDIRKNLNKCCRHVLTELKKRSRV